MGWNGSRGGNALKPLSRIRSSSFWPTGRNRIVVERLPIRSPWMHSQEPLAAWIGALQDHLGHVIVDEGVEHLGDEALAVRALLDDAGALGGVGGAAVPHLVVPHHAVA